MINPYREPGKPYTPNIPDLSAEKYRLELLRSQRRTDVVVSVLKWLGISLLITAFSMLIYFAVKYESDRRHKCEDRGGVWLSRESKCVPGFPKGK